MPFRFNPFTDRLDLTDTVGGTPSIQTITGNDGTPESPTAGNFNILTANATPKFAGSASTETLDFGLPNLVLGSSLPSLAGATGATGFGYQALNSLTSGNSNTAVGYQSLNALTTTSSHTALGFYALKSLTAGQGNTALGYVCLNAMTSGNTNVAIGFSSMTSATSGNNNTAVGGNALSNILTGSSNIAVGYQSGNNYVGSETGNILLGHAGVAAESNVTRIGTAQTQCYLAGVLNGNSGRVINVTSPGAYPYTSLISDYLILVDTTSARTIVPLASPITGQMYRIKDNVGSALLNPITITPSGKNIDGAASYIMNVNYGSVDIVYNGSEWSIV